MKISGITIPLAALCLTVHAVTATAAPDPFFAVPTARELPLDTRILSESVRDGVRTQSVTFRGADFEDTLRVFQAREREEKIQRFVGRGGVKPRLRPLAQFLQARVDARSL